MSPTSANSDHQIRTIMLDGDKYYVSLRVGYDGVEYLGRLRFTEVKSEITYQDRRMVGLFAFWYGCLHLLTYIVFDQFFDFRAMLHDVVKRPFITAGMTAFLLMVPLAVTSTSGWVRRMGGKRWALLHRLIYFSAMAGVIHYYWLVKSDVTMPVRFAVVVGMPFPSATA